MDDERALRQALDSLDPSVLNYSEWTQVGMALKEEGLPCEVWDEWSRRDPARYHPGECERKWSTFQSSGSTGGTIVFLAERYGNYQVSRDLDWDDGLDAYYEEVLTNEDKGDKPYQMAVRYLEALFKPDEPVSFVSGARYIEERNKWVPANAGAVRKCSDLVSDLNKHRGLEDAFGSINPEAGAWIRFNPTTGPSDKNVTRFDYALAESDALDIEEQKKLLIGFKLPIAALVESGGKSVHAIVKVNARDQAEYKQRTQFLYDWLAQHKFIVDENNKNPARLSRLPGAERKGNVQKLLATDIGCETWLEWVDYIEGVDDDLPGMCNLWEQSQNPPELSPELISGVLREGCKMIITGDSKAGKTCLSQNLTVCLAEGIPWLGKFQCQKGKVLYINLEVEEASLYQRFRSMYQALGLKMNKSGCSNIVTWNLRGKAEAINKLTPKIIRRCRNTGPYKAIVIDPLYKVQLGDENSAESIISFCNAMDKIAHETGAAVIYDHHHPKGNAKEKVIDRGAGSGVFARDADAIVDISNLSPGNDAADVVAELMDQGEKPMEMSFVLRDFADIKSQKIWFSFPLHYIDKAGILDNCHVEGSYEANFSKNENRRSMDDKKRILDQAFSECEKDGIARLSEMEAVAKIGKRTLREYAEQVGGYELTKGYIRKCT